MSSLYEGPLPKASPPTRTHWQTRLTVSATLLIWLVFAVALFWLLAQLGHGLLILAIGALIAYALYPVERFLHRFMPRALSIILVYLVTFGAIGFLIYYIALIVVRQLVQLTKTVQQLIASNDPGPLAPILNLLDQFGINENQINTLGRELVTQLEGVARNLVPLVSNVFSLSLNTILIALLSVYFILSGPRAVAWLRTKTPVRAQGPLNTFLDISGTVIGGYIRGTILLATVISTLTGIGLAIIGVPYAILLAVVAFVMEFIPVLGIYVTGFAILLLALSKGWLVVLLAVGFMLLMQLLENNLFAPRIVGGAVGLNPIVTLFALIVGSDLFGIAGAFFAAPAAGLIQALIQAFWKTWREQHPEDFAPKKVENAELAHELEQSGEVNANKSD